MISADALVPIPDAIDDRTAAAVMMQGLTASHFATEFYPVQPAEVTLVHVSWRRINVANFLDRVAALVGGLAGEWTFTAPKRDPRCKPLCTRYCAAAYDGAAAQRFQEELVRIDRVFKRFRTEFLGKVSLAHLFWGSFDAANPSVLP